MHLPSIDPATLAWIFAGIVALAGAFAIAAAKGLGGKAGEDLYAAIKRVWNKFGMGNKFMPLPEACQVAFDKLHGTDVGEMAHAWGQNPQEKLDVMAGHLAAVITIWGARPPATVKEPLSAVLLRQGAFNDGAANFRRFNDATPTHANLAVKRGDFRKALKELAKLEG